MIKFVCIFLFNLHIAWAMQGELTPAQNGSLDLEEGALFSGVLRVWPVKSIETLSNSLKLLEGKKLGENFHFIRIQEIIPSKHNAEVIEVKANLALIKATTPNQALELELDTKKIPIEIRNINTIATAPPGQEFILVEQPNQQKLRFDSPVIFTSMGVLVILSLTVFYGLKTIKQKRRETRRRETAQNMIMNAKSREDFELIGKDLNMLGQILNLNSQAVNEYREILNRYQYRRHWEDETLAVMRKKATDLLNV